VTPETGAEAGQKPDVRDNAEAGRFELLIDGEVVGFSAYQRFGNSIVFTHTEVSPSRQEHGLAGQLVQAALDQVRDTTKLRVVAQCSFVAHWLSKHPDYQDLLSR
jgi:predicted GNAT family acetyltransferase